MCGLAGIQRMGHLPVKARMAFIYALCIGIDKRGGDAAGYVAVTENGFMDVDRATGTWDDNLRLAMVAGALAEHTLAVHARFATCGTKTKADAHPFTIRRDNKVVLVGMHNGIIYDARDSANLNSREYSVDSKELFELLADGERTAISKLSGYGTIVWFHPEDPREVKLCRMTSDAQLSICSIKGGGIAWASTREIIDKACRVANVEVDIEYEVIVGAVHSIRDGELFVARKDQVTLGARKWSTRSSSGGSHYSDDSFWRDYIDSRYGGYSRSSTGRAWTSNRDSNTDDIITSADDVDGVDETKWDRHTLPGGGIKWTRKQLTIGDKPESDDELDETGPFSNDDDEYLTALAEEDEERKLDICRCYSIDPADVVDLSADDLEAYVEQLTA